MNINEKTKGISFSSALCIAFALALIALPIFFDGTTPPTKAENATQHRDAITAQAKETSGTIKKVTAADYATELDTADNVLIQLCKPDQCATDRAALEALQPGFKNVKFVQMNIADNAEFANRLETEQNQMAKQDKSIKPLSYPVYIFKGADLQVAPALKSEAELKQFIEVNASALTPEGAEKEGN
jgi:hypothetical protein